MRICNFFFNLLKKFLPHLVLVAAPGLPPVMVSKGYPLPPVFRLLTVVAALVAEHSLLECSDFSTCSSRLQSMGSGAVVIELGCPAACGIQTRDQTCVPCIGRQIFNCWTTREAPHWLFTTFILWVKTTDFPFKKLVVDHQGAHKFWGSFNFSPRILFFFDIIVNSTVFLILFWDCSLLMCWNIIDLYILTLYPSALMNLFSSFK